MARKRIFAPEQLKSWDAVNEALRQIYQIESEIAVTVAQYNEEEAKRRKVLDEFQNPRKAKIEDLESSIREFCETHKPDFNGKKSKELQNGVVGWRLSMPKVQQLKGLTWKAVLELVRRSEKFARKYIRTKDELDKDAIILDFQQQQISNEELVKVGVSVVQEDTFGYQLNVAAE